MSDKNRQLWLAGYQWLAGLSDTSTGLLLLCAPQWTLTLMGIHDLPRPIAFASFVGAFVLGVGLTYLLAAGWPMNPANAARWQTVWAMTAVIRAVIALFLLTAIALGRMEMAWLTVAMFDGALAILQGAGLIRGWLRFAH